MKAKKRLIALVASIGILGSVGTAYAADFKTPAEIVAGLTGKTVTEVTADRADGSTYGTIAADAGKLDQFKAEMLEQKKAILNQRVEEGTLTQEQADAISQTIETNQAACDGTGNAGIGKMYGAGFGRGAMASQGRGLGFGGGGRGMGFGQGANIR